jgi:hypothetical protein
MEGWMGRPQSQPLRNLLGEYNFSDTKLRDSVGILQLTEGSTWRAIRYRIKSPRCEMHT